MAQQQPRPDRPVRFPPTARPAWQDDRGAHYVRKSVFVRPCECSRPRLSTAAIATNGERVCLSCYRPVRRTA